MFSSAPRMPIGIYHEASRIESIKVGQKRLAFTIHVTGFDPQKVFTREYYEYTINSLGEIRIYGSSNDVVFLDGIMNYDWFWDGKNIIREDRKTGNVVTFVRESEPPHNHPQANQSTGNATVPE